LILDRPVAPNIGPISWLHLLAAFTLILLYRAARLAQAGKIDEHRKAMLGLIVFGLGIPALFAVATPDRIMHGVFFEAQTNIRSNP